MPNIGPLEIAIVLAIVIVLFGAKRLPELGRSAGKGVREVRSSVLGKDGKGGDGLLPDLGLSQEDEKDKQGPTKKVDN